MAFVTISNGVDTIELEIETESAQETEPEFIGSIARTFAGGFRSDREEFRGWSFVAVNLFQAAYDALRAMVKNDAVLTIDGDAFGDAAPVTGIVQLGEAPFVDDARDALGFSRTVAITVKQG